MLRGGETAGGKNDKKDEFLGGVAKVEAALSEHARLEVHQEELG